jgi:hypothetical protein
LIGMARPLYASEPFALDLAATVYAFDATTCHRPAYRIHSVIGV